MAFFKKGPLNICHCTSEAINLNKFSYVHGEVCPSFNREHGAIISWVMSNFQIGGWGKERDKRLQGTQGK